MSAPKILIQIVILGTQIFGKALVAAGRQAIQNAKHRPQGGLAGDAEGVGNATSTSLTDRLTREHRLTLDEAHMILNLKRGDPIEKVLKNYEHLFQANSPPVQPPPKLPNGRPAPQYYSHYLQSKVYRARERIEAELKASEGSSESSSPPTPPSNS